MLKNLSLYWKCQLIGWGVFLIVIVIFNHLIFHDTREFIPIAISIYFFGLLFSHATKTIIKKLRILEKKFVPQVISLLIISVLISAVGTLIWRTAMILQGSWKIETESGEDFIRRYFFNLFPVLMTMSGWVLIYFLFHYVKGVRREERLKTQYQLQLVEMEAKALRAQMNPHFIYNCMNSIKALIQDDDKKLAIEYLTTFSKLIRTLFQNSDKREINLYDEIETCKLYTDLESMRLNGKLTHEFQVDPNIDLKSVKVPALIIQPFIENAIWHGIVPKEKGMITVSVKGDDDKIVCEVEDDGIGRERSSLNKPVTPVIHESKGVHLSQARLKLEKKLNDTNATIETIDKYENDQSTGTRVLITFNLH